MSSPKTILLFSQVFIPDPTAVGQYMFEAAQNLAERGWEVRVFAADRGYEDPQLRFDRNETIKGVKIERMAWSSFGKKTISLRLLGQFSFLAQCFLRGVLSRRIDAILVTTSPPMGGVVAWAIAFFRRVPVHFWVMDVNPDQSVKLGAFREGHPFVRVFDAYMKRILKAAKTVIVLDRYMAEALRRKAAGRRLVAKRDASQKAGDRRKQVERGDGGAPELSLGGSNDIPEKRFPRLFVLHPWPMDDYLIPVKREDNSFLFEHGLDGKRVFLYSGNHSLAHPIATFLEAATQLEDDDAGVFLFVGGGKRKAEVDDAIERIGPKNVRSLPYQPLDRIRYSLSAGDIHLVSMGEEMVGCVHPCKFYSALSLGKPILYLGPKNSHIGDLLSGHDIGWQVDHGDVERMEAVCRNILAMSEEELWKKGDNAKRLVTDGPFRRDRLVERFVKIVSGEGMREAET